MGDLVNNLKIAVWGFWPVGVIVGALSAAFQAETLLILLISFLVVVDTITKLGAITTRYITDTTGLSSGEVGKMDIIFGFWYAIRSGYIMSRKFIIGFFRKVCLYGFLMIAALWLESLPPKDIFGIEVLNELADVIFIMILLTEMLSILENFKEMGSKGVDRIYSVFCWIGDKATSGKFSATVKITQEKSEGDK